MADILDYVITGCRGLIILVCPTSCPPSARCPTDSHFPRLELVYFPLTFFNADHYLSLRTGSWRVRVPGAILMCVISPSLFRNVFLTFLQAIRHNIKHNTVDRLKQILTGFNEECGTHHARSGKKQDIIDRIISSLDQWRATNAEDKWLKAKAIVAQVRSSGTYVPSFVLHLAIDACVLPTIVVVCFWLYLLIAYIQVFAISCLHGFIIRLDLKSKFYVSCQQHCKTSLP